MPAISAHAGTLSLAGEAASFENLLASRVGGALSPSFRVPADVRNRLDPASDPLVEVSPSGLEQDFAPAARSSYAVDYLFGVITFNVAPASGSVVRVSGNYLPVSAVALIRSLSLSVSNDVVELQVLGDGYKRRAVTLRDFSGEVSGIAPATTDFDSENGIPTFRSSLSSGAALLLEFGKGSDEIFRAWVKVPELSHKLTPGALYEHTAKFVGHAFKAGSGEFVAWGYGTP